MSEEEEFSHTGLSKSIKKIGQLYPILVNEKGEILDGNNRLKDNPNPEKKIVPTKNRYEDLNVRGAAHYRRRVPQEETRNVILEMAKEAEKLGTPKNEIARKVVEDLPYDESYVLRLLPDEYKNLRKSAAGKQGADLNQQKRKLDQAEKELFEKPTAHCSDPSCLCPLLENEIKIVDGRAYCFKHFVQAKIDFDNEQKRLEREKEAKNKPAKPRDVDSWESREAQMHPQHSEMEGKIVAGLKAKGYNVETDLRIVVYEEATTPDFNFVLSDGRVVHGYVDGSAAHKAKQKDRDEELRAMLRKKEPSCLIVAVDVKGTSDKEAEEKVAEIEEALKW